MERVIQNDSKEVGSGQAMEGFVGRVQQLSGFIIKSMWSHWYVMSREVLIRFECWETLATMWRMCWSWATIKVGRLLGTYWSDQGQMMAMDLGRDNRSGEHCRNLRNIWMVNRECMGCEREENIKDLRNQVIGDAIFRAQGHRLVLVLGWFSQV